MSSTIKILHIIKSLGRGGAEMLLPETLKYHNQSQYEFHYIYFLPWKNQMVSTIEKHGGIVTCIKSSNNIAIIGKVPELVSYIKKHNIRMIHCHLPWAGIAGRLAAKMTKIPVIYTEHNNFSRYHRLTKIASRLTLSLNELIIPVSADAYQALRGIVKPEKVRLILNGVDTAKFKRDHTKHSLKAELNIPEDHLVISTAAVFREQKRLDNFIKVAESLAAKYEKVSFMMVGDGPEKGKIQAQGAPLVAKGRLHFAGLQQEVKPFFNITDIFLMTSDFEGLPIALLEAMSMSCAVVATSVGGIPEVIEQGKSGLLCEANDVECLKNSVTLLIEDKQKRQALALEARNRIEQHFSMSKMVLELESVYHQFAKNGVHDKNRN